MIATSAPSAASIADSAIGLFIAYRDEIGASEADARMLAVAEILTDAADDPLGLWADLYALTGMEP